MIASAVLCTLTLIRVHAELQHPFMTYPSVEWLCNYEAGFSRRGLAGELILRFSQLTNWTPICILLAINLLSYLFVAGFLIRNVTRISGLTFFQRLFLMAGPPLCGMLTMHGFLRKEGIFYVFTILHLLLIDQSFRIGATSERAISTASVRAYSVKLIILVASVGVFCELTHESFVLLCLPANSLLTWLILRQKNQLAWTKTILLYSPIGVAALKCAFSHPTEFMCFRMMKAWTPLIGSQYLGLYDFGPFSFLTHPLASPKTLIEHAHPAGIIIWVFLLALFSALSFGTLKAVSTSCRLGKNTVVTTLILGFSLLGAAPLYFIGSDWGRWFSATILSAALILTSGIGAFHWDLMLPPTVLRNLHFLDNRASKFSTRVSNSSVALVVATFLLGMPAVLPPNPDLRDLVNGEAAQFGKVVLQSKPRFPMSDYNPQRVNMTKLQMYVSLDAKRK